MELIRERKSLIFIIAAFFPLLLSLPPAASAEGTFSRIVVFGTSLSDPGNAFAIWHEKSTPPYDTLDQFAIPDHPYAKSGLHYTNGATWIEQFSRPLGLAGSVRPAFAARGGEASNYAVGRARAREDAGTAGFINLPAQVSAFLSDHSGTAPADALYVVEIGSNDLKDALESFAAGRDGGAIIASSGSMLRVPGGSSSGTCRTSGSPRRCGPLTRPLPEWPSRRHCCRQHSMPTSICCSDICSVFRASRSYAWMQRGY